MHLISHFYNEEFLLPFWLKHHVPLVDHGIMIDYGSTDNSVDIIRELAPDWEIRKTRNEFFVEPEIGQEVMEIEESIQGWKMVLNTTEFVLHPNLKEYVQKLNKPGICTTGVIMVDKKDEKGQSDPDKLLVAQKNWGYFEVDVLKRKSTTGMGRTSRSRLLHRQPRGKYSLGRHTNRIAKEQDPNLFLCWFGWSPFNPEVRARKKQIQEKAPEAQKRRKLWAKCYVVDDRRLEEMYLEEEARSYNLLDNAKYAAALQRFKDARSGFFERHSG